MSILSKSKPGSEVAVPASRQPEPVGEKGRKRPAGSPALSASPRANLLPPEIGIAIRGKSVRSGLRFVVVAAAVIAIAGVAGAWQLSVAAQTSLSRAQQRTQYLAAETAKYNDVASTTSGIAAGKAAVKVGGGPDIAWSDYLGKLQATLPEGVQLSSVTINSADAETQFAQSNIPLEGVRIATITFSADSATLPSIPDWVDGLSTLPGFADASPNSVSSADGGYTASVTMHVNTDAYSHRFAPATKEAGK